MLAVSVTVSVLLCTVSNHYTYLQIMLNGAPGCGKTSCFAVASEAMRLLGYCVQTTKICLNRGIEDIGGYWDNRYQLLLCLNSCLRTAQFRIICLLAN